MATTANHADQERRILLGERIRRAYVARGLNRNQLSKEIDVYYHHVLKWEQGKTSPNIANLIAIARATGVSTDWLLGLDRRETEVPPVVDAVIAELAEQLDDDLKQQIRAIPWRTSVSTGTVRSYAFDLMLEKRRAQPPERVRRRKTATR
jgi:transcriptional regulator with XRE-family HTH domain